MKDRTNPRRGPAIAMIILAAVGHAGIGETADTDAPAAISRESWPREDDYCLVSWLHGFPGRIPEAPWHRCIRTGRHAFVIDTATLTVPHMGPVEPASYATAVRGDPAEIARLPAADLGLFVRTSGTTYRCTAGRPWDGLAGPRLVETGRWFTRADVDGLVFTAADGTVLDAEARFETIAWPDRLTLLLAARPALAPIRPGEACFGRAGGGFGLDGRNHLEVPHSEKIDTPRFTLEFWVYSPVDLDSATKAYPWLACKNYHEQADGNYGISVQNGMPQARLNIGGGRDNAFTVASNTRLAPEAWNHLAMTYDGSVLRLFQNGEPRGEVQIDRPRRPGKQGLSFGRRQDGTGDGYHFKGAIDEIRIYDAALSAEQVRERFRTPETEKPPADPKPVFVRAFRSEGQAAATRPRHEWHEAGLAIQLNAGAERLKARAAVPKDAAADSWHEVAFSFDPVTMKRIDEAAGEEAAGVPSPVTVEAVPLAADGTVAKPLQVDVDTRRGWHRIDLDPVETVLAARKPPAEPLPGVAIDARNDAIERVRLRLANVTDDEQTVRLLCEKKAFRGGARTGSPITGLSAILRDSSGHPTGIPVQLSKNWHTGRGGTPYAGQWLHGFTQVRLPAHGTADLELVLAYGHWGGVAAASHAQLSLLGWGSNQLWDESAMGSWGESICYEPDCVQGKCAILDVRPLMVTSMGEGKPFQWTRNVGGGDFFRLFGTDGSMRPHGAMKTAYERYGPCLTEVTYAGRIGTGIDHAETVSLARTDDIVRGVYRIRMDVREPVEFSRFALFQIGADTYSYARERKMAVGAATGMAREWASQWGGDTYRTEPTELPGPAAWASLHEADPADEKKGGGLANRGIVIREWRAVLGGREVRPWVAEHGTGARGTGTSTIDVVPPPGLSRLEPGDFVDATIEHLVIPATVTDYYGPSGPLREALATMQNTWRMVHREAAGNARRVTVQKGRLEHLHPDVRVAAEDGRAEFTIRGGLGYVPITVTGLPTHRGGPLTVDGVTCDQSVHGNDFWQTDFDPETGTWSRTLTLPLPEGAEHAIRFEAATP